jgi:hypothetical protein
MAKRVFGIGLAIFVVVGAILWIPWATQKRQVIASTPVPPALFGITPAPLKPGSNACMSLVTFDPDTQVGEIGADPGKKPGPPLAIVATAPGYRATARIPGGYKYSPALQFNLTPPKRSVIGQLCVRNTGKRTVSLNGSTEYRTMGRPILAIDGAVQPMHAHLAFYARTQQSYVSRLGPIFSHASAFTPPFLSQALLILIALLALIGIPVGAYAALAIAARDDGID